MSVSAYATEIGQPRDQWQSTVQSTRAPVQTMRALVLENDLRCGENISAALKTAGFGIDHADGTDDAIDMCRFWSFDLVVVDLRPDVLGFEAVCRLRSARVDVPILIIVASTAVAARIRALSLGADDVATGELCEPELAARIKALVRRSRGLARPRLQIGGLWLDLLAREATIDGRVVELTNKEYAMLEVLATRMGAAVRKEAFLHQLYGGLEEPSLKAVDVLMCRLRQNSAPRVSATSSVLSAVTGMRRVRPPTRRLVTGTRRGVSYSSPPEPGSAERRPRRDA